MFQETPKEGATAAEASVRGASSNPVAAETATAASAEETSKHTDAYASPNSAPLKRFRDHGQRRLIEKSRESIDNKEWLSLMKNMESSPSVCRNRKHPESLKGDGIPFANKPSKKRKHKASIEDSDCPLVSTPGSKSKYQASAEESGSPLASMPIRKAKYQITVEDAPSPQAPRTKMKSDRQEVIMEDLTDTGEESGSEGEVEDQDDKVEVPEIKTQQKFHGFRFDVFDDTPNPLARPQLTVRDSTIDVLGNVRKSTATPQEPGAANEVLAPAEPVTAAANEAGKEKSPAPIESRAGPTTHVSGNSVLDDIQNKPSGPPTIHDSAINVLKDVRDPPEKAHLTDDNSARHPLDATDVTPDQRGSLQPLVHNSNNDFENEAEPPTPTIEDAGMDFVDDDLEPLARPDLTYHDSAIDVSNDTPNDTFYDIMKEITSSPVKPDPIAATFTANVPQETQKPPAIFRKKRKERADSMGLDGDDEASSTVRSPFSHGRSRKRPLRGPTIDRLAEFPHSFPERRKILVSSGYRVDAEELPSQHKYQASVSRKSQELKGDGVLTAHIDDTIVNLDFSLSEDSAIYAPITKQQEMIPVLGIPDNTVKAPNEEKPEDWEDWLLDLDFSEYLKDGQGLYDDPTPTKTQRMALVPRITFSNHSHPTLAAARTRSGSPERQQWYKLRMSLNVVDPGLKAWESSIRITHQLDGFEGAIEHKITACSPKIRPSHLNLTPEWGKVSDVDLARSTVPFDHLTGEGWCDQFGLMHPSGNFSSRGTIKLKDLTPSDCIRCVPSQMHIQILRDPGGSKQRINEEIDKAWKKQLKEYGCKHKAPIDVQVISKHDDRGKDNQRPNGDSIRKRQCTKCQRRRTRYNRSDRAFEYCCLDISSEEESQEELVPFRRPFQEIIGDYYDLGAIESGNDDEYLVDFYTLPMTAPWPVQSESGTDDDEARDGEPNKAWTMVCESMKRNLASSNGTSNERPSEGLTMVCESKERRFNSSEDINDYFEDPDPNGDIAEDIKNENLEVVGDGDKGEEQVMRLRGGGLPERHNEFGLDENDLAAGETSEEKYPAQGESQDDGQSEVSGQNSAKRRKVGSGWRKGKVQRNGESKMNRKWDSRRRKRQSNGNEKCKDDQQNDGNEQNDSNRKSARHREAGSGGEKESNSQIKRASGQKESSGESDGYGQNKSSGQIEENIQAEDPFDSPGQEAVDRMWEENAEQNRARACRLGQECEDPFACWCEGMQEIEDSNLW